MPCLWLPSQVKAVQYANLLEEGEYELKIEDGKLEMEVGPFEIVTLKLLTR